MRIGEFLVSGCRAENVQSVSYKWGFLRQRGFLEVGGFSGAAQHQVMVRDSGRGVNIGKTEVQTEGKCRHAC